MAMHQYFEDIHQLIKEESEVAQLIAMEAMKLTQRVTGSDARLIDPALLRTLTALVVKRLDVDDVIDRYQQRERRKAVNQQIDASVQHKQTNRFEE
ncbi:hypothetical protein DJFAAGMI_04523 [Comamonas sp. PE63]|uniref:Uncharacterized protein n=1 Tax=Comamonas brasiliensis TaxID=1812482 RepID=A0ABS5LYY2_9BURK|nr:hypothetical protein [Comamonas sp. PE63]MBS3021747.1 hypothetical protein [Comamonas sp. PE63]